MNNEDQKSNTEAEPSEVSTSDLLAGLSRKYRVMAASYARAMRTAEKAKCWRVYDNACSMYIALKMCSEDVMDLADKQNNQRSRNYIKRCPRRKLFG